MSANLGPAWTTSPATSWKDARRHLEALAVLSQNSPSDLGHFTPRLVAAPPTTDAKGSLMTDAADTLAVGLSRDWEELPLEPAAFDTHRDRTVAVLRKRGVPAPERRRVELLLDHAREILEAQHARLVATMVVPPADDDVDGPAQLVAAAAVLTGQSRAELGAPSPLTVDLLRRGLAQQQVDDGADGGVNVEPPHEVEVGGQPAVRMVRYHRMVSPEAVMEHLSHTTLLPHSKGEGLATLSLVTPNVELSEPMSRLFDGIAATLRVFHPDEPTSFVP